MKFTHFFITAAIATALFSGCNDETSSLGNSLVNDETEVVIDSSFTATLTPVRDASVLSRTVTKLIGSINAKEYGSLRSDFVTQFMPSAALDTAGVTEADIDSIKLMMSYASGSFTGDSLVPMGFKVYPLKKQLESPLYSNFNPEDYYDESDCWTTRTHIYTGNELHNDSLSRSGVRTISVKLPLEFGKKFFNEYVKNPSTFASPQAFSKFFPGIYVKNTFGTGRVTNVALTYMDLYYRKHAKVTTNSGTRDTLYYRSATYMRVTPEVISNNIISLSMSDDINNRFTQGQPMIVAPTGYNTRLVFPVRDIINKFKANGGDLSVINTLAMNIPVEEITNSYNIAPPAYVLLILESEREQFFIQNKINDDKTSFLAAYDPTSKSYNFPSLRQYLLDMIAKGDLKEADYTFTLMPVDITSESSGSDYYGNTSSYITSIQPYVSGPVMCRILPEKVKIRFTYSKQSVNN